MPAYQVPSIQKWRQNKNLLRAAVLLCPCLLHTTVWNFAPFRLGCWLQYSANAFSFPLSQKGVLARELLFPRGGYQILLLLKSTADLTRIYIKLI